MMRRVWVVLAVLGCLGLGAGSARAWLIRPASSLAENILLDYQTIWPPALIGNTSPMFVTKWPNEEQGRNGTQAFFIPVGDNELSEDRTYLLDPSIEWHFDRWISRIDQTYLPSFSQYHAIEVTAVKPQGNTTYMMLYNAKNAKLFESNSKDIWRLPKYFFEKLPFLNKAEDSQESNPTVIKEIVSPSGSTVEISVLKDNQTGTLTGLVAKQTGTGKPVHSVFLLPPGGPWDRAEVKAIDFVGRKETFSIVELRGPKRKIKAHLNPWRGFFVPSSFDYSVLTNWVGGRPLYATEEYTIHENMVQDVENRNASYSRLNADSPLSVLHPDLSYLFTSRSTPSDFTPPPNNPYRINIKQITHTYDLDEIYYCSDLADSRFIIVDMEKSGTRALWELAKRCRWRQQRWLSVPDKPGPDEYALIEYEVPFYAPGAEQESTTTYIVGLNPWRAFIAEAVPQSGTPQAQARVEPPDFAPLANLPADLFPGKTLRLLEQAVWPR